MLHRPIVRAAVGADVESLAIFGQRLIDNDPYLVVSGFDPITGAALLEATIENSPRSQFARIFVTEIDGKWAALALCRCHPPPERDTILQLDLGVDAAHRRRGLGSALVQHAIAWARDAGIHRIQLAVVADNAPTVVLYLKHGFEIEGILHRGFHLVGKFHDVLVMARILK
jgi:GNAT superfamily N-acetyltransferase